MTAGRLGNLQQWCWFHANPNGLLADASLREHLHVATVTMYDWMHTALQNGTVTDEVFLFLKERQRLGHRFRDIDAILQQDWVSR